MFVIPIVFIKNSFWQCFVCGCSWWKLKQLKNFQRSNCIENFNKIYLTFIYWKGLYLIIMMQFSALYFLYKHVELEKHEIVNHQMRRCKHMANNLKPHLFDNQSQYYLFII